MPLKVHADRDLRVDAITPIGHIYTMATYIYETIPSDVDEKPLRFEVQQSMKDEPLTQHPENGKPVKRVITGGYGYSQKSTSSPSSSGGCGSGCGCHN